MLNSNEIRLLLSELDLEGSFIQKVTEHDYHSFTLSMFSKREKAFLLYFETGTRNQHFCRTGIMRRKSAKAQRFTQYLRANIVGSRIMSVDQVEGERTFTFTLSHGGITRKLVFRFFSGPGANVIVTDEDDMILELQMRRPQRGEEKGRILVCETGRTWDEERFPIRPWQGDSFNSFIDRWYTEAVKEERTSDARGLLQAQRDRELAGLRNRIRDVSLREEKSRDHESLRKTADLLSSYAYMLTRGLSSVDVYDFEGNPVTILLDPSLFPSENINAFYQKYRRQERIHQNALEELDQLKTRLEERTEYYDALLNGGDVQLQTLEKALDRQVPSGHDRPPLEAGLRFFSHGFEILVGRNAKENDSLLRHAARSNDTWLHVRDFAGGYVIIKAKKDKSIPLDVLLDSACLAIHYSKAKSQGRADIYYTQVKYLRRIKDGRTGLVTPTREKNLFVVLDEQRIRKLTGSGQEEGS